MGTTVGDGTTDAKATTTLGDGPTGAPKSTTIAAKGSTTVDKATATSVVATTTAVPDTTTVPPRTTSPPAHMDVITGELSLVVSDTALFQTNANVAVALGEAMAELLEIPRSQVHILSITAFASAQRRLKEAEGEAKVQYKISDPSKVVTLKQVIMMAPKLPQVANAALDLQGVKAIVRSAKIPMPTKQTNPTDPCATVATTTAAKAADPCATVATTTAAKAADPCQVTTTTAAATTTGADINPCSTVGTESTEAPVKASKAMPWQTKAEIAAASVAGAGAIAGGIAGIVKAEEAGRPATTVAQPNVTPKPRVVTVTVVVPVKPAPPAVSVKYEESSQKQAVAVAAGITPQTMVVGMGLFVGCLLIGISGVVLFRASQKRRASQIHAFAELSGDESA
jgi:hypothetical protein